MRRTRQLFLRLFGLTAMIAVGSFWWQLPGLVGRNGIAPAGEFVEALRRARDVSFFDIPTLAWLSSSDAMLHALCALALLSAVLVVAGIAPRAALVTLWASWLSLTQVCHPFLDFQWDILLVETAFCAAFFAPPGLRPRLESEPEPSPAFRFLVAWLACKVTLESGIVKLASGDPAWRDLTALTYHWWTQPLPTWTSFIGAAFPTWSQQLMVAIMFVLELPIPLLALGPRRARIISALGLMSLQAGLALAGNYSYYNLLAFVLAVPLLDDEVLAKLRPKWTPLPGSPRRARAWEIAVTCLLVLVGVAAFTRRGIESELLRKPLRAIGAFETINAYGAFAWMTKTRAEIILEGSNDGVTWQAYELPWKPGRVDRRPTFVAPWQPRLDWQLWFAALGECQDNPWVFSLQRKLLEGSPPVLSLFETNPFPEAPPKFIRTRRFEYRFAPLSEKNTWWTRSETGPYCPQL